ncbi:MAG: phosphoenolpyruvate--protein phosphotransferase [Fusobacteriaceae bacterium]
MIKELSGKSASEGIVIAEIYIYSKQENEIEKREILSVSIESEKERLREAIKKSQHDLRELQKNLNGKISKNELEILVSHILMLDDPEFKKNLFKFIESNLVNVEWAVKEIGDRYFHMFDKIKDPIYNQKKMDIRDICGRIISNLTEKKNMKNEIEGKILVAKEIFPSELLKLVAENQDIKGIILEYGGETSHVAILAKSLEIPTLLGVEGIEELERGEEIILDSRKGWEKLYIHPDEKIKAIYLTYLENLEKSREEYEKVVKLPTVTLDGKKISLKINISGVLDLYEIERKNPDGVGLFRTELMYMESAKFPSEEEQFQEYLEVVSKFDADKEIIIRTLDIGADKKLPYYEMEKEDNPFLGVRGIRHSLKNKGILKEQLRAILRVADGRQVKIMYPMITNLKEVLEVKNIVEECKEELKKEGKSFKSNIEQGIMVEVPSAVIMADQLAKHVDFFSIGTNDLTQYILATDRLSESLIELYDSYEPGVLRAINSVAEAGKKFNKKVSVCGEMAGEELAILAFLSMGIYDLSMVKSSVLRARKVIRELDLSKIESLKEKILSADSGKEVREILQSFIHI